MVYGRTIIGFTSRSDFIAVGFALQPIVYSDVLPPVAHSGVPRSLPGYCNF